MILIYNLKYIHTYVYQIRIRYVVNSKHTRDKERYYILEYSEGGDAGVGQ